MRIRTKKTIISLCLLSMAASAVFSNSLRCPFMWDDTEQIINNPYIRDYGNPAFLLDTRYWNQEHPAARGLYRPVVEISFMADHFLWGNNPFGYHLTNVIIHIANVVMLWFLFGAIADITSGRQRGKPHRTVPFLGALLFAVHPIHTESVTWVKNRSDLLCLLFFCLSLLAFIGVIRSSGKSLKILKMAASLMAFVLCLGSKAMGVTLPILAGVIVILFVEKNKRKQTGMMTAPFFLLSAIYVVFRYLGSGKAYGASLNGAGISSPGVVLATLSEYLKLLLMPVGLNAERILYIPGSFMTPENAIRVAVLLLFVFLSRLYLKRRDKVPVFSILWVFITLIPVLNLFYLAGRPLAEQRLYIPSAGFCLLSSYMLAGIPPVILSRSARLKTVNAGKSVICVVLLFYSLTTLRRNIDWSDPERFWTVTTKNSPGSSRAFYNLGTVFGEKKLYKKEIDSYKEAIRLNPRYGEAYYNLARAYEDTGRLEEAVSNYRHAISAGTSGLERAYNNLGNIYLYMGAEEKAEKMYRVALAIAKPRIELYQNLGNMLFKQGRYSEAMDIFSKAIEIDHGHVASYNNLGIIYAAERKDYKAIEMFRKAIGIDPGYMKAYLNLGKVLVGSGMRDEAIEVYGKALKRYPSSPEIIEALTSLRGEGVAAMSDNRERDLQ